MGLDFTDRKRSIKQTFQSTNTLMILLASACYWAWFDAMFFRPTLFLPFSDSLGFYQVYFIPAILSSAIVLLIAVTRRVGFAFALDIRPHGITLILLALLSSSLVLFGAFLGNPVAIILGAVGTGAACSSFLLGWAHIYSGSGAKSACFFISGAICIGMIIDLLIIGLIPAFAALFSSLLPVVFVPLLCLANSRLKAAKEPESLVELPEFFQSTSSTGQNEQGQSEGNRSRRGQSESGQNGHVQSGRDQSGHDQDERGQSGQAVHSDEQGRPITFVSIFPQKRMRFFGFSFSLVVAFFVFGFSFGYAQFNTAFNQTEFYPFTSDVLLVSRGITSLLIFLAVLFFPKHVYTIFRIGILVGIAGFASVPLLSTLANYNIIIGLVFAVGYTTFDIITWTLLAELSYMTGESVKRTFGPGRFVVHISISVDFVVALLLGLQPETIQLREAAYTTIGYLLVVAEMLLLSESSVLSMLLRSKVPAVCEDTDRSVTESRISYDAHNVRQIVDSSGLTGRETEILHYLLAGRSRPRIAQILHISENTVSSHIQHIYHKLDVHGLQELLDRFSEGSMPHTPDRSV